MDHTTRMGDRHGFAKVLVELTVESECLDHVLLWPDEDSSIRIGITYCNLPPICLVCQLFGITGTCAEHQGKQWVAKPMHSEKGITIQGQENGNDSVTRKVNLDQQVTSGKGKEVVIYDDDP
ncbi:unnamed protein product [Linum trigynum]|uniref:Uncharacterized protein n=1 Tax=Linum trigynum TaxID=586398 RepID=A0AAV2FYD2_9ROSI